jgi:hypothetical protein
MIGYTAWIIDAVDESRARRNDAVSTPFLLRRTPAVLLQANTADGQLVPAVGESSWLGRALGRGFTRRASGRR